MRLTHYDEHKKRWQINNDHGTVVIDGLNYAVGEAIDKLAAYEDMELTPEAVKSQSARHGQWKNGHCTGCGKDVASYLDVWTNVQQFSYCPFCGARMDLEVMNE